MADSQPTRECRIGQSVTYKNHAFIDRSGIRYGMLVAIEAVPPSRGRTKWRCSCDCGQQVVVAAGNLSSGNSKSCGCANPRAKYRGLNLSGRRFGMLVAGEKVGAVKWLCKCDCGKSKPVAQSALMAGRISCGCMESVVKTHGMSHTNIYSIWKHIISRCENKRDAAYHGYGGRGIKICERWSVFENFYADMGDKPRGKSIDRIDNDGNYEPSNCRWATSTEQGCNKRNNRIVSVNGRSVPLSQACREHSIDVRVAAARLRYGWSEHDALTVPNLGAGKRRRKHA